MRRNEVCQVVQVPAWLFDAMRKRGHLPFAVEPGASAEVSEHGVLALAVQLAVIGPDRASNAAAQRFTLAGLPLLPDYASPSPVAAIVQASRSGDLWIAEESIAWRGRHAHFRHHAGLIERILAASTALNNRDRHGGFERQSLRFCNVSAVARTLLLRLPQQTEHANVARHLAAV